MKAIVCHRYGAPEALRPEEVDKPTPGDGQVLIRIRAASLNAMDWHFMKGRPPIARLFLGLRRPKLNRPGVDLAGRVESVGAGVTRFKPGDDVFGLGRGSLAEYACTTESRLATKPASVSFEEAAAIPVAGLTALHALRKGGTLVGQRVLITGASGGVGHLAVQLARRRQGSRHHSRIRAIQLASQDARKHPLLLWMGGNVKELQQLRWLAEE